MHGVAVSPKVLGDEGEEKNCEQLVARDASRWEKLVIAFLICLCHVISYADRFNMSVAILHMEKDYGYTSEDKGLVFAAFFYGYLITQVIGGLMASTSFLGPKSLLTFACMTWSMFTLLIPACADISYGMLVAARFGLGAAEGLYIPACAALIASWFASYERGTMMALQHAGQCLGAVVAMSCAPVAATNWRLLFHSLGAIGLLWCVLFHVLGSGGPLRSHSSSPIYMPDAEVTSYGSTGTDNAHTQEQEEADYISIITNSAFWAIAAAHFAYNWSWYLILSWLPEYLVDSYPISTEDVGRYAMWPYMAAAGFCIIWARIVDGALLSGKLTLLHSRVISELVSCLGPICALLTLLSCGNGKSATWTAGLMTAAVGIQAAGQSGFFVNILDVGGVQNSGRVAALSNTIGTLPGAFGNILVGHLLGDWGGGWHTVFGTMIFAHVFGLIVFLSFVRVDEVRF